MLKGGKTRTVFSGTPGNPGYKYDHIEQDNIHYISSCTFPTSSIKFYKLEKKRYGEVAYGLRYQPDNLQFVRVEGDKYIVRTIVVGEWSSKNLSSRFWSEVERPYGRREHLTHLFHEAFNTFKRFSLGNLICGGAGLFGGLLIAVFWQRRRFRQ